MPTSHAARSRAWRARNPEKYQRGTRERAWRRLGILNAKDQPFRWMDYLELLAAQGGCCAVCGARPAGHALHVDHDHRTGQARQLLCVGCNTALGAAGDDPARLRLLASYLERHA